MDGKKLRDYARLKAEKAGFEKKVKECNGDIKKLQDAILKDFQKEGIKNVTLANGANVHLVRKVYVSRGTGVIAEDLHKCLRKLGLEDLITETVSAPTMKSYVMERMEDKEKPLEKALEKLLNIGEEFTVNVLGAGEALPSGD